MNEGLKEGAAVVGRYKVVISYLQYADDTLLVFEGNEGEVKVRFPSWSEVKDDCNNNCNFVV